MRTFMDTAFIIKRLVQSGSKSTYAEIDSGVGHFRQLDDRTSEINSIQYGEGWKMTVDEDTNVIVTDRIEIGSDVYEVRGKRTESFGSLSFYELLLVKKKS